MALPNPTITLTHTGVVSANSGTLPSGATFSAPGFNVGAFTSSVYLGDIGRRNSLGGGVSIYGHGQDQYLDYGTPAVVAATGDVILSIAVGTLAYLVAMGVVTVSYSSY